MAVVIVLLGINSLLPVWTENPYMDGIYRSFIVGMIWLWLTYKLRISEEICSLLKKYLPL